MILCREHILKELTLFGKIAMSADVCNLGWSMRSERSAFSVRLRRLQGKGLEDCLGVG